MPNPKNDTTNKQPVSKNIMEKANISEGEIDLMDYFWIVWRRKYFIVLGSVLPALIVFLFIYFSPRDYKLTYLYDIGLTEKTYKILLDKFYSAENLGKLTAKIKENELNGYWQKMNGSNVKLEVSPSYFGNNAAKATDVEKLQKIQEVTGTLLAMTVTGRPRIDMEKISSIIRDDFEKVLPIYDTKQELNTTIIDLKTEMADIEENKFRLELKLKSKKAISEKLKKMEPADSNKIPSGIVLQFNRVEQSSEYLPLAYQIQAADANIIDLEETIRAKQEKYDYYEDLLSLNEKLFVQVQDKTSSYYTIQEFLSSLTDIVDNYEDKELIDYLNAYIKKIENVISTNTPIVENPRISSIDKSAYKKSAVVFAVLLMITTLTAFLLEGIQKRLVQTS